MRGSIRIGLMVLLAYGGALCAAPSSQVAWTPEILKHVQGADPANGKQLAAVCAACHGAEGVSQNPEWPSLAGQGAFYLYKQLQDYKQGTRQNPIMSAQVAGLDDKAMADLAVFYAGLPLPPAVESADAQGPSQAAEVLAKRGDSQRLIPACDSCHGRGGRQNIYDIPALAGQQPNYLRLTMQAFKDGHRANDVYSRMRLMAQQLSEEEIGQLAQYYASLGAK